MKLVCQKGHYPYEFIDDYNKLHHETLPPKEAFYSKLKMEGITDKEYARAENVYKHFKCRSFFEYHWLY